MRGRLRKKVSFGETFLGGSGILAILSEQEPWESNWGEKTGTSESINSLRTRKCSTLTWGLK